MKPIALLACILAAALAGSPLMARDKTHHRDQTPQPMTQNQTSDGFDYGMQAVVHTAAEGEQGHGWQYFSDPARLRAVVISPDGQYYLSRGKGLRWVAGVQS